MGWLMKRMKQYGQVGSERFVATGGGRARCGHDGGGLDPGLQHWAGTWSARASRYCWEGYDAVELMLVGMLVVGRAAWRGCSWRW